MQRLRLLTDQPPALGDTGLLIIRLALAAVFIAHGWGDVFQAGVSTNVQNYRDAGIPLPALSAPYAAYMQLLGGILLGLGVLSRPVAAGLSIVMIGALTWVHPGEPLVMAQDGSGSGYAFIVGAASIGLLLTGPGRFSLDHILTQRLSSPQPQATRSLRNSSA